MRSSPASKELLRAFTTKGMMWRRHYDGMKSLPSSPSVTVINLRCKINHYYHYRYYTVFFFKGITCAAIWNTISCCLSLENLAGLNKAQELLDFIPQWDAELDHLCIRLRVALLQKDQLKTLQLTRQIGTIRRQDFK